MGKITINGKDLTFIASPETISFKDLANKGNATIDGNMFGDDTSAWITLEAGQDPTDNFTNLYYNEYPKQYLSVNNKDNKTMRIGGASISINWKKYATNWDDFCNNYPKFIVFLDAKIQQYIEDDGDKYGDFDEMTDRHFNTTTITGKTLKKYNRDNYGSVMYWGAPDNNSLSNNFIMFNNGVRGTHNAQYNIYQQYQMWVDGDKLYFYFELMGYFNFRGGMLGECGIKNSDDKPICNIADIVFYRKGQPIPQSVIDSTNKEIEAKKKLRLKQAKIEAEMNN